MAKNRLRLHLVPDCWVKEGGSSVSIVHYGGSFIFLVTFVAPLYLLNQGLQLSWPCNLHVAGDVRP